MNNNHCMTISLIPSGKLYWLYRINYELDIFHRCGKCPGQAMWLLYLKTRTYLY